MVNPGLSPWSSVRLPWSRFRRPPYDPGRSDFPSPVLTLACRSTCLPTPKEAQTLTRIHPARSWFAWIDFVPSLRAMAPPAQCPGPAQDRQVPRAPLHAWGVTPYAVTSCTTSESITSPSSLLRAHAPDQIPPNGFSLPGRSVFAGCRQSLLGDGPSRCYLRSPCSGAWTHTPQRLSGALVRFFPESFGLTLQRRGSTRHTMADTQR